MNRFTIRPGNVSDATLNVPGDKSITHRAYILAAIADGDSSITGALKSADCDATRVALESLGVGFENRDHEIIVHGLGLHGLSAPDQELDCGNSGTTMRLLMGLLCTQSFESTLSGDASLMARPMERVAEPLRQMGALVQTNNGGAPVHIMPVERLTGIRYETPVASAQLKSAILLAGLYANGVTDIREPDATRDHTERLLAVFGADCDTNEFFRLTGGGELVPANVVIPGDFSSAAFFVVAALIGGDKPLTVRHIGLNETRVGLLSLLKRMGADIKISDLDDMADSGGEPVGTITIAPARTRGIEVNANDVASAIDEMPVFCVAAACADGKTRIGGAGELRIKESDRLAAIARLMDVLGVECTLFDDGLEIVGTNEFRGGEYDADGDHRMAMAACIAGLRCKTPLTIDGAGNINTSFPGFVDVARSAGMLIQL